MSSSNQQNARTSETESGSPRRGSFKTLAVALLLVAATTATSATAGVLPVNSRAFGQGYGQLTAKWWQWALSIPAATNPLLDTTGEFGGVGQSGQIWFLAGTFGDSVERTVKVPSGKALFLPVHNWIFGAIANDCEPSVPGVVCDIPTLQASAAAAAEAATVLEVFIDGGPVADVRAYRAASPGGFSVTLPEGNVLGFPAGTYGPQVADGYWLLLTPLSVGQHTLVVHAVNPPAGIAYTVTIHVNVTP